MYTSVSSAMTQYFQDYGGLIFEVFHYYKTTGTAERCIAVERLLRLVLCASGSRLRWRQCSVGACALLEDAGRSFYL